MLSKMDVRAQGLGRRAAEGPINWPAMVNSLCHSDTTPSVHTMNVQVGFPAG